MISERKDTSVFPCRRNLNGVGWEVRVHWYCRFPDNGYGRVILASTPMLLIGFFFYSCCALMDNYRRKHQQNAQPCCIWLILKCNDCNVFRHSSCRLQGLHISYMYKTDFMYNWCAVLENGPKRVETRWSCNILIPIIYNDIVHFVVVS